MASLAVVAFEGGWRVLDVGSALATHLERQRPQSQGSTDQDTSNSGNHLASSLWTKVVTSQIGLIDYLRMVSDGDVQRGRM